jgi:hypothetical protein
VVVREALAAVLRHVERLPPSARTDELDAWGQDCVQETARWIASRPTDGEQDVLMQRVLELHLEVTKLERVALLTVVRARSPSGKHG